MGYCTPDQYETLNRSVRGVPIPVRISRVQTEPPTGEQIRIILRTLEHVPVPHLRLLSPPGHIQVSRPGCAPRRGGGNGGLSRWIRLSAAAIGADYNRTLNVTLLHELGHVIDSVYGGMRWLQDNDRDGYRLLAATGHTGATQFPGERFADCYMIFLITQVAGRSYNHRADPSAYRGEQAMRRYRILLNTPAFEGWTGPLSDLRADAPPVPSTTPGGPGPRPMPPA